ncbi:MAG: restriction endonuclease subunit S, partial [Methanoregula sp.]|nr:restriction endonuclease subunit S [Methanoregula sp.]
MGERELPEGWEWKRLGDVGQYINGKAFKPSDWTTSGKPIVRIQNLTSEESNYNFFQGECEERYLIKNGDILISWSASLGVFVWKGGDAVLNQHIFKAIPNEKIIDRKFLVYIVGSILEGMKKYSHGSTMKHIVKGDFDNSKIPLPPLQVQHQIVALLEQAKVVKRQRKEADALTGALLQNIFRELFGDLTKNEMGWDIFKLENICTKITDGTHVTPVYLEKGVPFLSVRNLTKGYLDFDDVKYISESEHRYITKRSKPEKGDILLTKVGVNYGIAEIVDVETEFSIFVSLALLKPKFDLVDPYYLKHCINSDFVYRQAQNRISGIGVPDLHLVEIKQFKIPLPPLTLQQQFARVVQDVERIREQQVASGRQIEG